MATCLLFVRRCDHTSILCVTPSLTAGKFALQYLLFVHVLGVRARDLVKHPAHGFRQPCSRGEAQRAQHNSLQVGARVTNEAFPPVHWTAVLRRLPDRIISKHSDEPVKRVSSATSVACVFASIVRLRYATTSLISADERLDFGKRGSSKYAVYIAGCRIASQWSDTICWRSVARLPYFSRWPTAARSGGRTSTTAGSRTRTAS